ncbi:MAG: MCE family protein [Pseudonocardia sp.]|nr:MCE family protein [Pseudonocardia sp.]
MISRATLLKLGLFVLLTAGLVLYIGTVFLGLFSFIRPKPYTVHLPLGDASGLFARSEVTFRGVDVGSVGQLRLNRNGVVADLTIDGSAPKIPVDLQAVVASRSAVGERYVDLRPNSDAGPFLTDGSTIPANRVSVPLPVENVLLNLDKLVATVPLDDLRTVVAELGKAFNGLAPALRLLLDSTSSLTDTATENLPRTLRLIRDARTVLQTQNDLADPIKSFSFNLKLVSEQLKRSDPDIRRLLRTGPDAARQISGLLEESGGGLSDTIREALRTSYILRSRLDPIQQVLIAYPILTSYIPTLAPGDGTAHIGLTANFNDPSVCTRGYGATVRRPGTDTRRPWPINYRAYCREPIFSPIGVRDIKPQYPFINGRPARPPEWFSAFYTDGPAAGIFGPPIMAHRNNTEDYDYSRASHSPTERSRTEHSHARPELTSEPKMPGLLNAPGQRGQFGLTSVLLMFPR